MEERKTLLAYIGPGPWLALACVLLLAAALLCAFYTPPVVEFVPSYPPPIPADSPAFSDSDTEGELCELPVIAISFAISQTDDGRLYYVVEEAESHYLRIASVSGETYALMDKQRALFSDHGSPVETFRLTGRRTAIPAEVKQGFQQVFEGMDDEMFDVNFGLMCLTEEPVVEPETGRSPAWTVFAVLFSLGFLAVFALWLIRFLSAWSALVRLEDNDRLGEAAAQLGGADAKTERDDSLRLTKDFLFGWRSGLAASWEDVVWSYERSVGLGSAVLARVLVICTADGKTHPVFFSAQEVRDLRRLANHLCERNPKMLWDDTAENRAAWSGRNV